MIILTAVFIGSLFSAGTYLLLQNSLFKVLFGLSLLSHGSNILILVMSGDPTNKVAPLVADQQLVYVDPVPQALILTAIVIGFSVSAFTIVFFYRLYQITNSIEIKEIFSGGENE